ncbi:hypothetical protein ACOXXX_18265 [Thalassococcus sp. BH17M4-6]|uniref:hypothetical protein n=1 Tax=Thalassococcus sp. BH17M4-6 TaxID=3413148 RepID=UPI003BC2CA27
MPRLLPALALCALLPGGASAQTLLSGDHSVDGRLCAGLSCTAAESFTATEALRLKGANVGIRFVDDDTTGSNIPNDDWEIRLGDSFANGQEYFGVVDISTGRKVFHIGNSAPENAFFMAENGYIGLGTSLPETALHIETSINEGLTISSPTTVGPRQAFEMYVNLQGGFSLSNRTERALVFLIEQDAPYLFEANATKFHVNPVPFLSTVDFQVSSDEGVALFVENTDGNTGMGTTTPAAPLHILRADNSARILIEDSGNNGAQEMFRLKNNGGSFFTFENAASGTTWFFTHENAAPNRFIIADAVADGPEMSLTADGDLTIPGQLFTGGSCAAGCDRVFDADYPLPSIAEQAAMMRDLKHLPAVGPTPEDGPFNITAMTGGMLNELEKAHLYIARLEERLAVLERDRDEMADLRAQVAALSEEITASRK